MNRIFEERALGRTGFKVGPLGLGAYGLEPEGYEEAFERGVRYFYWAWVRRSGMGEGLQRLCARHRDQIFISITSLAPTGSMIGWSVDRVREAIGSDYIDCLQFYLFAERGPMQSLQLRHALELKERGVIRHIGFSTHHRPTIPLFAKEEFADVCHVRYNAIHRGAEEEVFPQLPPKDDPHRPGMVAFTATSWRQLLKPDPARLGDLPVPTAGDCYRFALSASDIDVCLAGPSNMEHLHHALDAVEKGPMSAEELLWMRQVGEKLKR